MNDEQLDAAIREAFESLETPPELVERLAPERPASTWRFDAIFVGVAAVAALALFVPYMLVESQLGDGARDEAPASFQPPAGTRVIRLEAAGVHDGWPEAGAVVDVLAVREEAGEIAVEALLEEAPVAESAREGGLSVAVDPSLAVRAIHGSQTAALTVAMVLPDGRRVVELRERSPVSIGDRVDVLVTAEREGELQTWTAIRSAEVVYLGPEGPLVALGADEAAEAVAIQHRGAIRLSRHLDRGP